MPGRTVCRALIAVAVVLGLYVRFWYASHWAIDADQGVVGLIGAAILHGHFSAFYWGQTYGGVEPYVVAVCFALFGQSTLSLGLAPIALVAVAAILTWRAALRLVDDRMIAALAGSLVWITPAFGITNVREYGFRDAALVCGAASLLLALRVLDGDHRYVCLAGFGLAVGVGWWASPESSYFALPATAMLLGAVITSWQSRGTWFWLPRLSTAAGAALAGALPWLWSNVPDGFLSLDSSKEALPGSGDYLSHLHTFFVDVLPMQLGVTHYGNGALLVSGVGGIVLGGLVEGALLVSVVLCLLAPGRRRVIGAAMIAFPLLFAMNPLSSFWGDGRYAIYLPPLVALTLAIACEQLLGLGTARSQRRTPRARHTNALRRARTRARAAMVVVATVALVMAGAAFWDFKDLASAGLGFGSDPETVSQQIITGLEYDHATVGYANYWVAYQLDFLSGQHLRFSPVNGDVVRSTMIYDQVVSVPEKAWLFVAPDHLSEAISQFGTTNVEAGSDSESNFLAALRGLHDPYVIDHALFVDAVVPERPVTPTQVGIVWYGT